MNISSQISTNKYFKLVFSLVEYFDCHMVKSIMLNAILSALSNRQNKAIHLAFPASQKNVDISKLLKTKCRPKIKTAIVEQKEHQMCFLEIKIN